MASSPRPKKTRAEFEDNLQKLVTHLEKARVSEYVALLQNTRRLLFVNFVSGLARGFGIAIGFSILGAVAIYILTRSYMINLPVIGGFIAEIVRIVQTQLTR